MNIVKEHINFERGLDPKDAMNIGQNAVWKNLKAGDILRIKKTLAGLGEDGIKGVMNKITSIEGYYNENNKVYKKMIMNDHDRWDISEEFFKELVINYEKNKL